MLERVPCGYIVIDEERRIVELNPEAERLLGVTKSDHLGKSLSLLLPAATRIFFHSYVFPELARTGRIEELYVALGGERSSIPFLLSASREEENDRVRYLLAFLPVRRRTLFVHQLEEARESERRAVSSERAAREEVRSMRDQLSFAERLTVMGKLAASVAHEINNPLTYVTYNIEYLRSLQSFGEWETLAPELLAEAAEGCMRIREIASDLKQLSRRDMPEHPVALERVIRTAIRMTASETRKSARLEYHAKAPEAEVLGEEGRLVQVLVNLIVNAAQACERDSVERNWIRIELLAEGDDAVVEVSDNGGGIPESLREKIFEPFFTTKPEGIGTGLGLAVCHGIVSDLGGSISLETRPSEGTTFRIVLPRLREA